MAEGETTTFRALTEKFNLPLGNYKKPKLLYCSNGGQFLRILPDGTVDGTKDKSDQHTATQCGKRRGGVYEYGDWPVLGHGHQRAFVRLTDTQ
uniref:Fibroblast growth factor 1 n=1 Tax=Moschus moschiferus TaxID=68415 RepID=A0A8C6CQQ8_MOSMO